MIEKFLENEQVNGLSQHTIKTEESFLKIVNTYKNLDEKWSKDDVNTFILKMQKDYSQATLETYKIILRKFFKWSGQADIVSHLKFKRVNNNIKRDDILTPDDIDKIIASTRNPMHKALVALLYESGGRISEVLALRVKDIQDTEKGIVACIPQTKTGNDNRRILCVLSGQYLMNHIAYSGLKPDDIVFRMHKANAWKLLVRLGDDAGIKKPCNPHAFRHASATSMVLQKYPESIIRKKMGWAGDSKMIGRYIHVAYDDVIDITAEKNGAQIPKPQVKNINPAQPVSIVNTAGTIAKILEESEHIMDENEKLRAQVEELTHNLDSANADNARIDKELQDLRAIVLKLAKQQAQE